MKQRRPHGYSPQSTLVWVLAVCSVFGLVSVTARAQTAEGEEPARAAVDQWRDTLRWGINSQIAELLPQLTDQRETRLATEVLQLFGTSEDVGVLRAALGYLRRLEIPDAHERALALLDDFRVRPPELNAELLRYLLETNARLTEDQLELLLTIAADTNSLQATAAVRTLASAQVPSERLIELYRTDGVVEDVRGQILVSLGERQDPETFSFVASLLEPDEDATTALQRFAIDALGKLGNAEAVPLLRRQLGARDALTRAYAVVALSNFGGQTAAGALFTGLRDDFWRVRVNALQAIAEHKIEDLTDMVAFKMRDDPEERVRIEAITTLVKLDTPSAWRALEERAVLQRLGRNERIAILSNLIEHRMPAALDTVMTVIEREWSTPNSLVLDAIGRAVALQAESVPRALVARLLEHQNYIIQIYAVRAAASAGLTALQETLRDRAQPGKHPALRAAAQQALSDLGISEEE